MKKTSASPFRTLGPSADAAPEAGELAALHRRVREAEETIRAIRSGEVDAVVITRNRGAKIFTLEGIDHAYRELIETMNEGALTLTVDKKILYANSCFARMVKSPLEKVTGSSFLRFISAEDQAALRSLLEKAGKAGAKIQMQLKVGDGSSLPVQISVRALAEDGLGHVIVGLVVTDMSESKRTEELMRSLTRRVVDVQEAERADVAVELHDHITQLLCAILFRCQALVDELSTSKGPSLIEAMRLRDMLGQTAQEVDRISRTLRPSVLDQLGLGALLSATSTAFADRTGVSVKLTCALLTSRLPADTELALYRILQEALKNIERHARARHVIVTLTKQVDSVCLSIKDDGIGFDLEHLPERRKKSGDLGLLGMRERATYVGGVLDIKSVRRAGTEIDVRIPVPVSDIVGNSLAAEVVLRASKRSA